MASTEQVEGNMLRGLPRFLATLALCSGVSATAVAETRGYVISYFIPAMYNVSDDECPNGMNVDSTKLLTRILRDKGKPQGEVEKAIDADALDMYVYGQLATFRGQVDGQPADVFLHPMSNPESMELMVSKFGIGFNLDGKDGPDKFTDPLTGETGVNNQMSRVLGCFTAYRGTPESRAQGTGKWSGVAWLIAVDGMNDIKDSEKVTVRILRAMQYVTTGSAGIQPNMTYTVDATDPRMQNNTYRGHIKDGVFVSDEPVDFFMLADSVRLSGASTNGIPSAGYDGLKHSRLRLAFNADGSLQGFLGGFQEIKMLYAGEATLRGVGEFSRARSYPAFYQAMVKLADTDIDKDPKTGMRTRISVTYQIGAVPAFLRSSK